MARQALATTRHEVLGRDPTHAGAVASVEHLRLGRGEQADPMVGLGPGWSLYSLELDEPRSAVFVRTDEPLDLSGPFIYAQQLDRAHEALVVPLDAFLHLASDVPAPTDMAFLFSTGRCGSTLASRIMATLPGVTSLSEPDVYNNIVEARATLDPDEAATLVQAATAVLCHGLGSGEGDRVVVKPRSQPVLHEDVYTAAFPEARHAFMYRDVLGYSVSLTRYVRRFLGELPRMPLTGLMDHWNVMTAFEPVSTLGRVVDVDRTDIGLHELIPTGWALSIKAHLAARERGDGNGRIEAIHYDDLVADRETETARLLGAGGLDPARTPHVLKVFEQDAHQGMVGGNDTPARPISDDELAEVAVQLPRLGLPTYKNQRL